MRKQFAAIVELDDVVAEQAPALRGLIRYYPCCEVVWCGPFRASRLMLTHAASVAGELAGWLRGRHARRAAQTVER
jgi:hypothetical protein